MPKLLSKLQPTRPFIKSIFVPLACCCLHLAYVSSWLQCPSLWCVKWCTVLLGRIMALVYLGPHVVGWAPLEGRFACLNMRVTTYSTWSHQLLLISMSEGYFHKLTRVISVCLSSFTCILRKFKRLPKKIIMSQTSLFVLTYIHFKNF